MKVSVEVRLSGGGETKIDFDEPAELLVGRDPACDVSLPESEVSASAKHLRLSLRDRQVFFEDLNSSNGVFLDGTKVTRGSLSPRQELSLGRQGPKVRVHFIAPTVLESSGIRSTRLEVLPPAGGEPIHGASPGTQQALTRVGSRTVMAMISEAIETARRDQGMQSRGTVFFQEIVRQTVRKESRGLRWGLTSLLGLVLLLGGYVAYSQVRAARVAREASSLMAMRFQESLARIDDSAATQAVNLEAVKRSYQAAQQGLEKRLAAAQAGSGEDRKKIAALREELLTTRSRADEISAALDQTRQAIDEARRESAQRIEDVRDQSRKEFKRALGDSLAYLEAKQKAYLAPHAAGPQGAAGAAAPAGGPASAVVQAPAGTVFIPTTRGAAVMKKRLAVNRVLVGSEVEAYGVSRPLVEASIRAIVSETLASTGRFEFVERVELAGIAQEKALAQKGLTGASGATDSPLSGAQILVGLAVTHVEVERHESTRPGFGSILSSLAGAFGGMAGTPGLGRDAEAIASGIARADIRINDQVTDTSLVATVKIAAMLRDAVTGQVRTVNAEGGSSSTRKSYTAVMSTAYMDAVRGGSVMQPQNPLTAAIADAAVRLSVQVNEAFATGTWRGRLVTVGAAGRVVLNAGSTAGLRNGDTFRLTRRGAPLKDPSSAEILGYTSTPVGEAFIETVEERTSICRFLGSPEAAPLAGDDAEFIGRTLALKEGETREDVERRVALEGVPSLLVRVASRKVKLYPAPSAESGGVKMPLVDGQVLPVAAKFGNWYQVLVGDKTLYLQRESGTELMGRSLAGLKLQVNKETIDLVASPVAGSKKVGRVTLGATLEPEYAVSGWYQTRLPNGASGWIPESGVRPFGKV